MKKKIFLQTLLEANDIRIRSDAIKDEIRGSTNFDEKQFSELNDFAQRFIKAIFLFAAFSAPEAVDRENFRRKT